MLPLLFVLLAKNVGANVMEVKMIFVTLTDYCSCVRHMCLKRWQETLHILERQHSDASAIERRCARSVADCWQVDRETLALLVKEAMAKRSIACERARS